MTHDQAGDGADPAGTAEVTAHDVTPGTASGKAPGTPSRPGAERMMSEEGVLPRHWLADLSGPTRAVRDLIEAQRNLTAHHAHLMGMGVTDMRALRLLDLHGPLGATELARLLDLRPASVTSLVDRLEAIAVVERVRDEHDRRRVVVQARPEALRANFAVWEPAVRAMDDVGHGLSTEQQRVVSDYLSAVTAAMKTAAVRTTPTSQDR